MVLGWLAGRDRGTSQAQEWKALVDELDGELVDTRAEVVKLDRAIVDLQHNLGVVWDAGFYAGQTFQGDRQSEGL